MSTPFWLRPLEALYFGPPSSMPAGDVHHGRTLFPPPPRTFQGMVRTRLLQSAATTLKHRLDEWKDAEAIRERQALIGPPEKLPNGWHLAGPHPIDCRVATKPVLWLPTPRFLLRTKHDKAEPLRAQRISDGKEEFLSDLPEAVLVGQPQVDGVHPLGGWLSARNLRWALTGTGIWDSAGHAGELPPFVRWEGRTGVGLAPDTGAARRGLLYSLVMVRFAENTGLYGVLDAPWQHPLQPGALHEGTVPAGRGARLAAFEPLSAEDPDWSFLCRGDHLTGLASEKPTWIWLVATTPLHLADPVRPQIRVPTGAQARVRAALLGKPLTLGGYAMGRGVQTNRLYVPAGSAWLVEVSGPQRMQVLRQMNNSHPFHAPGDADAGFGFGHVLVGLAS